MTQVSAIYGQHCVYVCVCVFLSKFREDGFLQSAFPIYPTDTVPLALDFISGKVSACANFKQYKYLK